MVKSIIISFVLFCSVGFAQSIGPRATVPQANYSYESVPMDSSASHTYMIYNGGGATLYLSDVKTSCSCISATLDQTQLAPTDSARLQVTYTNIGNSKKLDNYISIKTNDPSNPNIRIYLTRVMPTGAPTLSHMPADTGLVPEGASVSPMIYFPETSHNFGVMHQGDIADYVFKFYNRGNSTLIIKDIRTSCGCTAALVKNKEIAPNKEGELRVQFDSSGKIGKLSRKVSVYSNDPKEPTKMLTIYADVEKEIK